MGERRVKEHCIQRGLAWDDSLASTSCQEQEYYEDLLRFYRYNYRVGHFKNNPSASSGTRAGRVCRAAGIAAVPQNALIACHASWIQWDW